MKNIRTKKLAFLELRLDMMMGVFFVGFLIVIAKLFQIQVISHAKYKEMAENQYWTVHEVAAGRGSIYSSDGYLLAGTLDNYLMYGEPKVIDDKFKTAHELAQLLLEMKVNDSTLVDKSAKDDQDNTQDSTFESYYQKILDSLNLDLYWVPLTRDLSTEQKDRIADLGIKGIGFEKEPKRFYPEGVLASHVLGFVGSNEKGEKIGYYGIEGQLDEDLRGRPGRILEETDASGNPILAGGYKKLSSLPGRNVVLTIDRSMQYVVEKLLKEGVEKYDASSGSVIIMDPYTGKILVMANYPTYDPSDFTIPANKNETDTKIHRVSTERTNASVQDVYEPGSVMKPLTISAAVDLGLVTADTTYSDDGPVYYSGYKVDNWDFKHPGVLTIVQLLEKSNNIGAAWVGHKIGAEKLSKYLRDFGIGEKTGVELQGESTSIVRDASEWTDIDLANISFGQGISATPLQVLNAFNVIANGGILYKPLIISRIEEGKKVSEIEPKQIRRVISEETSNQMISMLEKSAESGEAKFFVTKEYKIAGKTGTAEIFEDGEYKADKSNATFVGFLSGSKKISMIVLLREPRESIYASLTSVPLWMSIMDELVKFYGIAPDKIPAKVSTLQ